MIALLEARAAGLFRVAHWRRNIVAGIVVGVVALPLAMAFAIASGARPEQGLYTAIVAGLAVSVFGGSRLQIAGPTGAFVVILAGITSQYGVSGLQIATLMAGIMLLLFGFARLGNIIRFIPDPVIVGFTAGIAVVIFVGQWPYFLGLDASVGGRLHEKVFATLTSLPQAHLATVALGLGSLAALAIVPRIRLLTRVPAPLLVLVLATVCQAVLHLPGVATLGSAFGGIPRTLPTFELPHITLTLALDLIGPAFAIAMLGSIESLLSAVVADGMAGTRHDSNQELIGQGIANVLAPLFGGFAATGAIARTATNARNGATGPLAGIVHALTLVIVILLFAPLAAHVPLAALAAILFLVAWNMSEARHFADMTRRAPRADVVVLLVTFFLTVFVDLVVAVNIGVILAILQFMRRMSETVEIRETRAVELESELRQAGIAQLPPGVLVYAIEGPFFFGAVENLERALAASHLDPSVLVLRFRWVPFVDMTGIQTLEDVIKVLQRRHVRVLLCEANERVRGKLERAQVERLVGADAIVPTLSEALALATLGSDRERPVK